MINQTPRKIIETILPALFSAAKYADRIQHRIEALEDKNDAENIFAAALSDADLSIQTMVEVAMIANFPELPFFGEEWKSSRNTKYLIDNFFLEGAPYLVTLDPIDGTRLYLDGHQLYQVILTVSSRDFIEAAIVLYPAYNDYVFAERGRGALYGKIGDNLQVALPWKVEGTKSRVYLASELVDLKWSLSQEFDEVYCGADYHKNLPIHYLSSAVRGELGGAISNSAQLIDGATLGFIAAEMGYLVTTHSGKPLPRIVDYPELVLPGIVVGDCERTHSLLKDAIKKHYLFKVEALS